MQRLLLWGGFWSSLLCCTNSIVWASTPQFEEVSDDALGFAHISPVSPERHLHLFMGSGLGWADLDRDGVLDLLFCQGAPAESMATANGTPALRLWCGNPDGFTDRSTSAALTGSSYAMGLSIGDFDNDGFADVFVTGMFAAALYRNNGDGTFSDQTKAADIHAGGFGSGACWTDVDRDGLLDLFFIRYVVMESPEKYPLCTTTATNGKKVSIGCNPVRMPGDADTVYRNRGDGTFVDFSAASTLATAPQRQGLGIVALDFDDDGQTEALVANDTSPNDLWVHTGNFQLEERAQLAGISVGRAGKPKAGMGIAVGDFDGDLRPDVYITNYYFEGNSLYRNEGGLLFIEASEEFGVAAPSRTRLGFGVTLADFDNDGWSDLLVANGHVHDHLLEIKEKNEPFAQLPQLLLNRRGTRFIDVSSTAGKFFTRPSVGRGTAAADVDGDGRVDVAFLRLDGRAALLQNTTALPGNWLAVQLRGTGSNRDGIGATVVVRSGKQAWRRDRMASASYLSCDSPVLHFGLGEAKSIDSITVRWPSGRHEVFTDVRTQQISLLVEGAGIVVPQ
mgnify:CR=1 FL=1